MSVGPEECVCYQCLDLYCWSNKVNERHLSIFVSYIQVLCWIAQNVTCTPVMYIPVTHTGPVHDITCTDRQHSQQLSNLLKKCFTNSIIIMNPQKNCGESCFFVYKPSLWIDRKTAVSKNFLQTLIMIMHPQKNCSVSKFFLYNYHYHESTEKLQCLNKITNSTISKNPQKNCSVSIFFFFFFTISTIIMNPQKNCSVLNFFLHTTIIMNLQKNCSVSNFFFL